MRSLLIAGSAAVVLALGVSGAYANGVLFSPYEILEPQSSAQPQPEVATEGRGAYIGDDAAQVAAPRKHIRRHVKPVQQPE
jgi:hypothetical protein